MTTNRNEGPQAVWIAIVMLSGLIAAACAGALFSIAGAGAVAVMGAGGATFVAVATLGIALVKLFSR